jgi:hypothetical protein
VPSADRARVALRRPAARRAAYLHDLEQRLLTKPVRLARRMVRHPVRFMVQLPGAVLRQPVKLAAELREVLQGDRR